MSCMPLLVDRNSANFICFCFTEEAAETLLRLLESTQLVTEEADHQPVIFKGDSGCNVIVEHLTVATTNALEEAVLLLVVATFVFNLKVTRRLKNVQFFVEHYVMRIEPEVRPSDEVKKALEMLSK